MAYEGMRAGERAEVFRERFDRLTDNIEVFVRGKRETIRLALVCLFAEGHLLIEDVPGVAKTSLAKAIAQSISGGRFKRIQFTPDLLPSDVTGFQVPKKGEEGRFTLIEGPVFANIVLADEINRASPKTQSAMLEVMAEHQVTLDGKRHEVPRPFLCVATQNPIEHHGTYALPEAQLDRFMMRIGIGYPGYGDEVDVVQNGMMRRAPEELSPVMDLEDMRFMMATAREVKAEPVVLEYLVGLTAATRRSSELRLGISPRGSIALATAAQAYAAAQGRHYITDDDVHRLAVPVLNHRLLLTPEAAVAGATAEAVLEKVLRNVPAPRLSSRR